MAHAKSNLTAGRVNQKHRTRNALLEAAARLMRAGQTPTVEQVADAAHISRATAYRYFPTQAHVLAGSAVLSANIESEELLQAALTPTDPALRLKIVVQAFCDRFAQNEAAYRTLLSLMLNRPKDESENPQKAYVRASRQLHWLTVALEPIRSEIGVKRFERLIAGLIASTSFEAYAALRDTCLLEPTTASEIMHWNAQLLLESSLTEGVRSKQVQKKGWGEKKRRRKRQAGVNY